MGSSPLSRGIHDNSLVTNITARIIPALAGNTRIKNGKLNLTGDHPRSRGEYPRGPTTIL